MSYARLGILAVYMSGARLEELPYYKKLTAEGKKLGLQIEVFTPTDVDNKETIRTLRYDSETGKWVRKRTTFPPVIYDRCRYHGPATFRLLKAFRNKFSRLTYLSKPLANKWTMHQVLSESAAISSHLPATVRYSGPQELIRFLKKHKLIYVKPKNGTGGRGILRIEQTDADRYLIQGRNQQRTIISPLRASEKQLSTKLHSLNLSADYVVQQGISLTLKDGRVHDYRLLIQKNGKGKWEVTGCAGRIGPYKSITSNLHGGGSAIPMEKLLYSRFQSRSKIEQIKNEIYRFAHELAPFLETKFGKLCELGIDIAVDPKGNVWLLEVNPKPSREVFHRIGEKETYRKAIKRPLEYALWMMKQRNHSDKDSESKDLESKAAAENKDGENSEAEK
ncbi:YheC/YheD family endospore coat-associated protein [Paenibacillus eucommiae]|uniref:ATP-grasp domain-containing protein n=1 Tax=Paenibacillus eucommiae TaxID=1355755 RepID=A0ABS4J0A6_9BACL|nr:YheC/YheD family protein [Paenibacillus eucommiae]MBP1993278.1 hypothetical protein [Paenibacillus eucommiae]